jgi:hypothetical protein
MTTTQKFIIFFLLILPLMGIAATKEIPFTLDDRDRIIRTEQKIESLKSEMNSKIDTRFDGLRSEMNARFETVNKQFAAVDQRFDQLFGFLWAIIGVFTTMMVSIFGFAFWDRKLSLAPVKKDNLKTLNALRDFAEHQPKLREILKNAGLM